MLVVSLLVLAIACYSRAQELFGLSGAGVGTPSDLFIIDKTTAAATLVGSTGLTEAVALAVDPITNILYAHSSNGDSLFTLSPTTGVATLVGSTGHQIPDMSFDSTGQLFGWTEGGPGASDDLVRIDKSTGAATVISVSLGTSGTGLAFDGSDRLFVKSSTSLQEINPATGALIGSQVTLSANARNLLAVEPGTNVFFTGDRSSGSFTLRTFDPVTGVVSDVGSNAIGSMAAIAFTVSTECGNGVVDAGETCGEPGLLPAGGCCNTFTCTITQSGRQCRNPTFACDTLFEVCDGVSTECPRDQIKPGGGERFLDGLDLLASAITQFNAAGVDTLATNVFIGDPPGRTLRVCADSDLGSFSNEHVEIFVDDGSGAGPVTIGLVDGTLDCVEVCADLPVPDVVGSSVTITSLTGSEVDSFCGINTITVDVDTVCPLGDALACPGQTYAFATQLNAGGTTAATLCVGINGGVLDVSLTDELFACTITLSSPDADAGLTALLAEYNGFTGYQCVVTTTDTGALIDFGAMSASGDAIGVGACSCAAFGDAEVGARKRGTALGSVGTSSVGTFNTAASASGDPHIVGAQGQRFDFYGKSNEIYTLFSAPQFVVNMQLLAQGPKDRYIDVVFVHFRNVTLRFDTGAYKLDKMQARINKQLAGVADARVVVGPRHSEIELCDGHRIVIKQRVDSDKIDHKQRKFYHLDVKIDVPGCHNDFGGILGETYRCDGEFKWDRSREEDFHIRFGHDVSKDSKFSPSAPCHDNAKVFAGRKIMSGNTGKKSMQQ